MCIVFIDFIYHSFKHSKNKVVAILPSTAFHLGTYFVVEHFRQVNFNSVLNTKVYYQYTLHYSSLHSHTCPVKAVDLPDPGMYSLLKLESSQTHNSNDSEKYSVLVFIY